MGCAEGEAVVLDTTSGDVLSSFKAGSGVDIIGYDPKLSHVYLPGATSATLAILGVSEKGQLSLLGTLPTATGSHCVTVDDNGTVYACDPKCGRILVLHDPYPTSRR